MPHSVAFGKGKNGTLLHMIRVLRYFATCKNSFDARSFIGSRNQDVRGHRAPKKLYAMRLQDRR